MNKLISQEVLGSGGATCLLTSGRQIAIRGNHRECSPPPPPTPAPTPAPPSPSPWAKNHHRMLGIGNKCRCQCHRRVDPSCNHGTNMERNYYGECSLSPISLELHRLGQRITIGQWELGTGDVVNVIAASIRPAIKEQIWKS